MGDGVAGGVEGGNLEEVMKESLLEQKVQVVSGIVPGRIRVRIRVVWRVRDEPVRSQLNSWKLPPRRLQPPGETLEESRAKLVVQDQVCPLVELGHHVGHEEEGA